MVPLTIFVIKESISYNLTQNTYDSKEKNSRPKQYNFTYKQ